MEELVKIRKSDGGKDIVSARELYEKLDIQTRFNDWMPRMFEYGFTENVDYSKLSIENQNYNFDFALTLDCAKEIAMVQRSDKGKIVRLYFIEKEKELKAIKDNIVQLPNFTDPAEAAIAWATEYKAKQLAEAKIKVLEPKAEVYDQIANTENLKTVGEVAKILGIGPNHFFDYLREQKILMYNNIPYQHFIDEGYLKVKVTVLDALSKNYSQTFFTPRGELWIAKKWQDHKQLALSHKN
jgi:anti-repressor protein